MTPDEFRSHLTSRGWVNQFPEMYYGWVDPITGKRYCSSSAFLIQLERDMKITSSSSFGFKDPYRERIKPLLREVLQKWLFELNSQENRDKIRSQVHSILKSNSFLRESQVQFHVLVEGEMDRLEVKVSYKVSDDNFPRNGRPVTITATIDSKTIGSAVSNA